MHHFLTACTANCGMGLEFDVRPRSPIDAVQVGRAKPPRRPVFMLVLIGLFLILAGLRYIAAQAGNLRAEQLLRAVCGLVGMAMVIDLAILGSVRMWRAIRRRQERLSAQIFPKKASTEELIRYAEQMTDRGFVPGRTVEVIEIKQDERRGSDDAR